MPTARKGTEADDLKCTSALKRPRRTKAEIRAIEDAIYDDLKNDNPATVRHCFYRMVAQGIVPKTHGNYITVQRALLKMRREGRVPWYWIADATRWRIKPTSYGSLLEAVEDCAAIYRRDIWRQANVYVEIWCESDSIAGIINRVTHEYDVPLLSSRGFSSDTFLYETGQQIAEVGRPAFVYYFGDWDDWGRRIPQKIEAGLRRHAPDADITFVRAAINRDQIKKYGLPTMPAKKRGAPRTVEIEALPVDVLLSIVRDCIEQHIDQRHLEIIKKAEESEREILNTVRAHIEYGQYDNEDYTS